MPTRSSEITRLSTMESIEARYDTPGPHATVVVPVPLHGVVGDSLDVRWNAARTELHHLGATPEMTSRLETVIRSSHRGGASLLMTANGFDSAYCWLSFEAAPSVTLGRLPSLLPAIRQLSTYGAVTIVASVDRIGADISSVDAFDITHLNTVDGEDEHIHKAASGGWSQMKHQHHSEELWRRNAEMVAEEILVQVHRLGANAVLLTGDDRATRLVEDALPLGTAPTIGRCRAGGRHEPETASRLRTAAIAEQAERATARRDRHLDDLREELGQHDRATAGTTEVLEAVTSNLVKTLFVDTCCNQHNDNVDAIVRAGLHRGAVLVTGTHLGVRDGIAAMLRAPYI